MENIYSNKPEVNAKVSVIIPCFKQAHYLPDALGSVLAQTYPHWECIIVNDGSPDHTEEVAQQWMAKDERFRYVKKENGGLSSARNAGLKAAKGEFIQFLDADDAIHPDKFTLQVEALSKLGPNSLSISDYFASVEDDLSIEYTKWYASPRFLTDNFLIELISRWERELTIPVHSYLFRTNIFVDNDIYFNENLPNHEDWECWMNVFKTKPCIVKIDVKLATYRIRSNSMCSDLNLMKKGYLNAIEIQKNTFNRRSIEWQLLNERFNYIKYGINESNKIKLILKSFIIKVKKILRRVKKYL